MRLRKEAYPIDVLMGYVWVDGVRGEDCSDHMKDVISLSCDEAGISPKDFWKSVSELTSDMQRFP